MKLNLKYTAAKVDEIEKESRLPIDECVNDATISNICLFIMKGLIDDNGRHGVSRTVAMDVIDKYLQEGDKDELVLDIWEELVNGGFLSKKLDVEKMREANQKRHNQINEQLDKVIQMK